MDWAYVISGSVVGFVVGLTGVGGGALMTPLLVLFFGIPPVTAVGTDLLFASITKVAGVGVHARRGNVEWRIAGLLACGSVPAALATLVVLEHLAAEGVSIDGLVTPVLGGALILTAFALLFKGRLQEKGWLVGRGLSERGRAIATVVTGAVLGALVTISSIGAGALGIAALLFLYPQLPAVRIVAADLAHAVGLTAVAGLGHLHMGTVDLNLLATLLIGSLPGIYLGSHLSASIPERVLRSALAAMLLLIGGRFVF